MRFVNDNLSEVIRVLIDLLEDNNGFSVSDFLPENNFRIEAKQWSEWIYDLYDLIKSNSIRDYIKPHYEYLLYTILHWFIECNIDDEKMLKYDITFKLEKAIMADNQLTDDEKSYIINAISYLSNYSSFIFDDLDFLPDNIANYTQIFLNNEELFRIFFDDIDLNDFYVLMPKDLQEQYTTKISYNKTDDKLNMQELLYEKILRSCERLQANYLYKNATENQRNDHLRDLLSSHFDFRDQTRQGLSVAGKDAGEIDILICNETFPVAIIEGVNLSSVSQKYISDHIDKIFKYDTIGNKFNFLISYVEVTDFQMFWNKYVSYISNYNYPCEKVAVIHPKQQFSELRTAIAVLKRNGMSTLLYHIAVHM